MFQVTAKQYQRVAVCGPGGNRMFAEPLVLPARKANSSLLYVGVLGLLAWMSFACSPQLSGEVFQSTEARGKSQGTQPTLTGYWVLRVSNGDGTFRSTYFQLEQNGEQIKGTLLINRRTGGVPLSGTF